MADFDATDTFGTTGVPSSELKKTWHAWLDRVEQGRDEVVVTRYGRPVARLIPYRESVREVTIFGYLAGTVTEHGDVVAPTDEAWEADG